MGGAFNYFPEHLGGERGLLPEVLLESLLEADGGAFAKDVDSVVWAERLAESRVLVYLWSLNRRFANQWDPLRTTDFLARWEAIYGLRPLATDTDVERRAKLAAKILAAGKPPIYQVVKDLVKAILGRNNGGLLHTLPADAVSRAPGGATIPGGPTIPDGAWYSTVAHVVILTNQYAGQSDAEFYEVVAQLGQYLDDLLPAWVTWDWVHDGPGGAGFFLDEEHNLDNERFD